MKLKHLISTSALVIAGIPTANAQSSFLMCQSCPAGTYSNGGSAKSCTPCPVGQYQDGTGASGCKTCPVGQYQDGTGASGCKTCHGNTNPTSVSGKNCGSITVDVTGYCRATGSTSSTANAAKVGTTTINLGNCSGNTYCSNNVCTACSKPENSKWDSGSGCGWHCASGYYPIGRTCSNEWELFKSYTTPADEDLYLYPGYYRVLMKGQGSLPEKGMWWGATSGTGNASKQCIWGQSERGNGYNSKEYEFIFNLHAPLNIHVKNNDAVEKEMTGNNIINGIKTESACKSAIGSVAGYSAYIHFNRQNAPVTMYKGKLSGGQYDNITAYGGSASEGTEMPFLNYGSKYTKSRNVYAKTNLGYIHIYKLK